MKGFPVAGQVFPGTLPRYRTSYLLSLRSPTGSGRADPRSAYGVGSRACKDSFVPWTRPAEEWRWPTESRNLLPLQRSRTAIWLNPHGTTESLPAADRASGRASATMRPSRSIRRMRSPESPAPAHDAALRACRRQDWPRRLLVAMATLVPNSENIHGNHSPEFLGRLSRSRPSGLPSRPAGSNTRARPRAWRCTGGNTSCG